MFLVLSIFFIAQSSNQIIYFLCKVAMVSFTIIEIIVPDRQFLCFLYLFFIIFLSRDSLVGLLNYNQGLRTCYLSHSINGVQSAACLPYLVRTIKTMPVSFCFVCMGIVAVSM